MLKLDFKSNPHGFTGRNSQTPAAKTVNFLAESEEASLYKLAQFQQNPAVGFAASEKMICSERGRPKAKTALV